MFSTEHANIATEVTENGPKAKPNHAELSFSSVLKPQLLSS